MPALDLHLTNSLQDVRGSARLFKSFQQDMRDLVAEVKARGPPAEDDVTVAAHLMRLRDPVTNQPLADDLLASEVRVCPDRSAARPAACMMMAVPSRTCPSTWVPDLATAVSMSLLVSPSVTMPPQTPSGAQFAVIYAAGLESAANALTWTM